MIGPVHHVGIAVERIEPALERYKALGIAPESIETVPAQGVRVAFLPAGPVRIEFVEPLSPQSPVATFLTKRGEGLHHLAFSCTDIVSDLATLARRGLDLIDRTPRPGAHGRRVAFVHPRSAHGVLLELVEERPGPS